MAYLNVEIKKELLEKAKERALEGGFTLKGYISNLIQKDL